MEYHIQAIRNGRSVAQGRGETIELAVDALKATVDEAVEQAEQGVERSMQNVRNVKRWRAELLGLVPEDAVVGEVVGV